MSAETNSCTGAYRDGALLKVRREGAQFLPRCIKSGERDDVAYHEISSEPDKAMQQGFVFTLGMLKGPGGIASASYVIQAQNQREQKLHLPLSQEWYESWKSVTTKGWLFIAAAMLGFLISCLFMAFGPVNVPEWVAGVMMIPMIISLLLAIAGLIYMALSQRPIFTIKKVTPEYLWITGVKPEVLAEYPEDIEALNN